MTRNLSFDIASAAIMLLVIIYFYRRKNIPLFQNKMFECLLWANFVSSAINIFYGIIVVGKINAPIVFSYIGVTGYYVAHSLCVPLSLMYVIGMMKTWHDFTRAERFFIIAPIIFVETEIIINPITKLIFYFDENMTYVRSGGIVLVYGVMAYYFVYLIVYLSIYKKYFSFLKRVSLMLLFTFALISILIQYYLPSQLVENCGISLCLLMLFFTIQNPTVLLDGRTGAYNRNAFVTITNLSFGAHNKFKIVNIVIDDFSILDKAVGIKLTTDIIKLLMNYLTSIGAKMVYRVAEGSFCVEFYDTSDMREITDKILNRLELPWKSGDYSAMIKARLCVTECPSDADNSSQLLDIVNWFENETESEKLVFVSKIEKGRMNRTAEIKLALERAIKNDNFEISYIPLYSFDGNSIVAAEAKIIIRDDTLGDIYPKEYIPVSEKNGFVSETGIIVFEKICRYISEKNLSGEGIDYVQVSLSAMQCLQFGIEKSFNDIMGRYNVRPEQICFLISESTATGSLSALKKYMDMFKSYGVRFCLNNYGIGYSNISYIYDLPFSFVKINKNVISAAAENRKACVTLESTLALVKELGMMTIVDGVDSHEYLSVLSAMRCDYAQGCCFSQPLSEEEFLTFLNVFSPPQIERREYFAL